MFKTKLSALLLRFSILSLLAFSSAANAEMKKNYEFQVIEGYGSSAAILEGNYQEAVELAKQSVKRGTAYDRAVNATSLCVAYAKMADIKMAKDACSKAVKVSTRIRDVSNIDRVARNNRSVVFALAHTVE